MASGGGGGNKWIAVLVGGALVCVAAMVLHHTHAAHRWVIAGLQAVGGLAVVFGSCEAMIKSVEGLGTRLKWNEFVAGTMAGLAANVPELVMLGFVVSKEPRMGFVVVALTLPVGALAFGIYCGLLPRDQSGQARMPEALAKVSTDLFAAAGGIYLVTGSLMLIMRQFSTARDVYLAPRDLYVLGAVLLLIQVVSIKRLINQYSSVDATVAPDVPGEAAQAPASTASIVGFGVLGLAASVFGGHSVGEFAGTVAAAFQNSEMIGAIILSVFACAGVVLMIATAHAKGKHELALSNAAGAVTQQPFVAQPVVLILIAVFCQIGVVDVPGLRVDLETTAVVFMGFPIMLILWKSINDDGKLNWLETTTMIAIFVLIVYFLAAHG